MLRPSSANSITRPLVAPLITTIEVTRRCNLDCAYCYSDRFGREELPGWKIVGLVRELHRRSVWQIVLSGGEPFLHPHIMPVLEAVASEDIPVGITTNGTPLTGEAFRRFVDLSRAFPKRVHLQVSVDGPTPEINDRLRGRGKAVFEAVEALVAAGVPVGLATVIHRHNVEVADRVIERFYPGVRRFHFIGLMPSRRVDESQTDLHAPGDAVKSLYSRLVAHRHRLVDAIITFPDASAILAGLSKPAMECAGCIGATTRMDINADGTALACNIADDSAIGNVWQHTLNEIWTSEAAEACRCETLPLCLRASLRRKTPSSTRVAPASAWQPGGRRPART